VLDQNATRTDHVEYKKQVDHFQHLITYYGGELIDSLRKKLIKHEQRLASILLELSEADAEYFHEHNGIIDELRAFDTTFHQFKYDFYNFIERGFSPYS
jgi:hypothetical protein